MSSAVAGAADDAPGSPATPPRRAAFAFIFVTVLLDMLALGMVIPVLPGLVVEFLGGDTAYGAEIVGVFGTAWALMQFLCAPVQGAISDRIGRRPVVLASNIGLGLDYLMMAVAPTLGWLFAGRLISGITSSSITTAFAYVADVTPPDRRAARFGLMGAAFGAGFVLGPALGGLAGAVDLRLPFWIAGGLSLINALYGLLILPESLPPERRARFSWANANPIGALVLLRRVPQLVGLAYVNFLCSLAHAVLPHVAVIYMAYRYRWDESMIGLSIGAVGAGAVIVQGMLMGAVVRRIGERATLIFGMVAGVAAFTVSGLADTGPQFLLAIPLMSLWGLANPAALGLMSRRVDATEQGRLQGANASLQGIANMIGPILFTVIFARAIDGSLGGHLPGAPFLVAAVLVAIGTVLAWHTTRAAVR